MSVEDSLSILGVGTVEGDAIISVVPTWEMGPAPQVIFTVSDRDGRIRSSPVFSPDYEGEGGASGAIPLGDIVSARHAGADWVAVSMTPGVQTTITLEHSISSTLRGKRGPLSAARGVNRANWAQGLLSLQGRASWETIVPEAKGVKPPLLDAQVVSQVKVQQEERDKVRAPGFADAVKFTVKGKAANADQKRLLAVAMSTADDLEASGKSVLALISAIIVESLATNLSYGDATSTGALQLLSSTAKNLGVDPRNVEAVCRLFLTKGFAKYSPVGAIGLARKHPGWTPGEIAQGCQGSAHPERYDQYVPEARRIVAAWSGSTSTLESPAESRGTFEVAAESNFWEASGTIADEVNRRRFIAAGNTVYWVAETTLARSRPYATLTPYDTGCVLVPGTIDELRSVDKLSAQLLLPRSACGDVIGRNFMVTDSASSGSWLAVKASRSGRGDRWIQVDLERPRNPLKEPAKAKTVRQGISSVTKDADNTSSSLRDRIMSEARATLTTKTGHNYYLAGGDQSRLSNPLAKAPYRSDCSQWIYAVYKRAGVKGNPGLTTVQMESLSKRTTRPKPGDLVLMNGHVELYAGGGKTYGHGSPPIDASTADYFIKSRGAWYATYDFLD